MRNVCDNCRYYPNKNQDPKEPERFGSLCTTRPAFLMGEDDDEEMFTNRAKRFFSTFLNIGSDTVEGLVDSYTTVATPFLNSIFPGLGNLICGVIDGVTDDSIPSYDCHLNTSLVITCVPSTNTATVPGCISNN